MQGASEIASGITAVIGGGTVAAVGTTVSGTGVGAVVGAPAAGVGGAVLVTGGALVAHGSVMGVVAINGIKNVLKDGNETPTTQKSNNTSKIQNPAKANKTKNIKKGIPENKLGPSGKPKINKVKHSTMKQAKDAAQQNAGKSGTTIKHATPKKGKSHFHGKTKKGTKKRTHHEFSKK